MEHSKYLKVKASNARKRSQEIISQARDTMRMLKDSNPDWDYGKCLIAAYAANGNGNLVINKHNL